MVQQSTITLSSLYSSGQCLLSVLGSIGVILLFAGIPQLIYSTPVNPGSLMTFLLGAILICLMVAGNAFIGYKYRQLVRARREESRNASSPSSQREDKPPSYDDLIKEDGLPPDYASSIVKEKPPRYEDLVAEVYNWPTIAKISESGIKESPQHHPVSPSMSAPSQFSKELPIIVPLHRNLSQNLEPTQPKIVAQLNLAFTNSLDDFKGGPTPEQPLPSSSSQGSASVISSKIQHHIRRSKSNVSNMLSLMGGKNPSSSSSSLQDTSIRIVNEVKDNSSGVILVIDDNMPSSSDDNSSHL